MTGYVFNMGGIDDSNYSDIVDVFKVTDTGVEKFASLQLSVPRCNLAAASCGNYILAMGGYAGSNYSDIVDVFQVIK